MRKRGHLEDLRAYGMIILKWGFKEWDEILWTGFISPRNRNKLEAPVNLVMHLRVARCEILTAMLMKIQVFWGITTFRVANRC